LPLLRKLPGVGYGTNLGGNGHSFFPFSSLSSREKKEGGDSRQVFESKGGGRGRERPFRCTKGKKKSLPPYFIASVTIRRPISAANTLLATIRKGEKEGGEEKKKKVVEPLRERTSGTSRLGPNAVVPGNRSHAKGVLSRVSGLVLTNPELNGGKKKKREDG